MEKLMYKKKVLDYDWKKRWDAHYKKNKLSTGHIRPMGLDMDTDFRIYRAVTIIQLSENELKMIHEREQRKMWSRFLMNWEMGEFLGRTIPRPRLTAELKEVVAPQIKKLKPTESWWESDGMDYHHLWDRNIWKSGIALPEEKKKVSERLK